MRLLFLITIYFGFMLLALEYITLGNQKDAICAYMVALLSLAFLAWTAIIYYINKSEE